ncbi:MAG: cytochrome c peroxidase [Planctomycetota bacterium]
MTRCIAPIAVLLLGVAHAILIRPQTTTASNVAAELRAVYAQPPDRWPQATVDEGVEPVEIGVLPDVVHPEGNEPTPARVALGRQLFFDPRLSASNQMACASCHDPDLGWADGRTVSFGDQRKMLRRNAPTALYAGHWDSLFWDGRSPTVEDLVIAVMTDEHELRSTREEVEAKFNAIPEYVAAFGEAYGVDRIAMEDLAGAVAVFLRENEEGNTPFDTFMRGRPEALTDQQIHGLHLFRTKARCMNCHHGPLFSDNQFHNTGLTLYGTRLEDRGRYEVTKDLADVGKFKTPTLRNVANTKPYMHHGLFESLEVTVTAYNGGMPDARRRKGMEDDPLFPVKSPLLHELGLTDEEKAALIAFMTSLSERHRVRRAPELPPDPPAE